VNCTNLINNFLKFEPLTRKTLGDRGQYFWDKKKQENSQENPDQNSDRFQVDASAAQRFPPP